MVLGKGHFQKLLNPIVSTISLKVNLVLFGPMKERGNKVVNYPQVGNEQSPILFWQWKRQSSRSLNQNVEKNDTSNTSSNLNFSDLQRGYVTEKYLRFSINTTSYIWTIVCSRIPGRHQSVPTSFSLLCFHRVANCGQCSNNASVGTFVHR